MTSLRAYLVLAVTLLLTTACSSGPPPPIETRSYEAQIAEHRRTKDDFFRSDSDESPLPAAQRASFTGLLYFPVDPAYHVPASLVEERRDPPVVINLNTSKNTLERYVRVGTLTFRLDGSVHTLAAFATASEGLSRLFVPFGDLTNRTETYHGGRYLNLDRTSTGLYDLDFNLAYNPYCVFNVNYTCPIPPAENRLDVAIRAGERMPK